MESNFYEDSSRRWLKPMKIIEVAILSCIILLVWGIFVVIPVVFYTLPPVKSSSVQNGETTVNNSGVCSQQKGYEGTVCSEELRQWQQCFSGLQTNDIHLPSNVDQQKAEDSATTLLLGLQFLAPSQECIAAIKPFMCLYLFGSCDSVTNQLRQVSQADCVRLRDELCPEQWKAANRILGEGTLPDCSIFKELEIQCLETNGTVVNQTSGTIDTTLASPSSLTCMDGFYVHNGSTCRQLCSSWLNLTGINADNIVTVASLVNAVLSSAIVITVMLTLLRNEILAFPKFYLIYLCSSTAFIGATKNYHYYRQFNAALIVLIGLFDKEKLFCSSIDLLESFMTESAYCTINGVAYHYGVIQIGLWTLFFTLGICWGIFFPFHYHKFKSAQRLKYIHAATILLSIVLPILPISIQLKDGYHISESPRRAICIGRNIDAIFYAFLLPFTILSAVITTLLVLIFWKILKELTLKKLSREKSSNLVGKAEAKILCVTCYYVLTSCIIIVTFIYSLVTSERNTELITNYLLCQSTGLQPGKQCGETPDMQLRVLNSLSTTSVFFQSYVPSIVLIFVAKFTWPKKSGNSPSRSRSKINVSR